MTDAILEVMKKVARNESRRIHTTELGVVTTVFPHADSGDNDNYQCSVTLKNRKLADGKDFELRQVPVATPYIGLAAIPNVGDLVLVSFIGGDINAPVIIGRLYNDEDRPPLNKKQEFLLRHSIADGPSVLLDSDGKIIMTSKDGKSTITMEDGKISIVSKGGKLLLQAEDVEITADSEMKLKGKTIDFD